MDINANMGGNSDSQYLSHRHIEIKNNKKLTGVKRNRSNLVITSVLKAYNWKNGLLLHRLLHGQREII